MPSGLTSPAVARRRLTAQLLAGPLAGRRSVADVVGRLGALQAQDRPSALVSLALRAGVDVGSVEAAVATREVVRTWPMRGTLHWVPAEDARWMCRLLSPPAARKAAPRRAQLGLTEEVEVAARRVVDDALADGPLSRPVLFERLRAAGIDPDGQRGYHLLVGFAQDGHLVQAGLDGRQPTFALLDQWVAHSRVVDDAEGLAIVVDRYLRGHGPATEADVAGWLGAPLTPTRRVLADLGDKVSREGDLLVAADALAPARTGRAQLLPMFDEYLLGYKDRSAVLSAKGARRVVPGSNGMFLPVLLYDGVVVGTWRRTERAAGVQIRVDHFPDSPRVPEPALAAAVTAYGTALGRPVSLG